ncbi:metallophosphoesterase [Neisseria zalophi]|uniref:Serine/threonine protein phosphatase n=1 Tax=Neisseria zalophi TaxID=640030 RepID=A0A5J6PWF7_9NEIS|nr:metallophosphoesterase [Neisseria zalophi]QEY27011.1 serine/threonine protein phosphatase [Neisseria zalophi]
MPYRYRQPLPDTPLDIIGDVHGELEPLQALLHQLGYNSDGSHPQGRKIVFVGDLCDRGPDSPAVLNWFFQAHQAGNALMVLGNHELNLLVSDPKDGSGWFFPQRGNADTERYAPWHILPDSEKSALTDWLAEQPLILERHDLRIVHAAWIARTFPVLDAAYGESIVEQYRRFDDELKQQLRTADWYADYLDEQQRYKSLLDDADHLPPAMPATAQYELNRSRLHPIRALTSGIEHLAAKPFYAGGRWRFTARYGWWNDYTDTVPVLIGHYWRSRYPQPPAPDRENILPAAGNAWHGANNNVFCVDFSIGARWRDRKHGIPPQQSKFFLAALRWPENVLVFHNGEREPTV